MKHQPKVTKPKKVGTRESLATPKPRKSRLLLTWSPTGKMFDQEGKIVDSSESKSQSDCVNGYSDLFMVIRFGLFQAYDRKSKASHQFRLEVYENWKFCDSDLEVAFRRNACFVKNLEGVNLLKGDHLTNLYTINLHEIASASPICLMARASFTKLWLWHQRLSHLNFDTINDLARNDLVAEEYEEDETEDGPVDYPMDEEDDGDDDGYDPSGYDADEEDEEEEEEEHIAPVDSTVVIPIDELASPPKGTEPIIPPPSTDSATTGARITIRPQTSISLPPEAEVERLLAMPTPSPSTLTSLSPPSVGERSKYEVGESFTRGRRVDYGFADTVETEMRHRGIREVGYGIRDTWIDLAEAVPEMAPTTLEKVNTRVTELAELHEHDTQDLYALLEDAQDVQAMIDQALLRNYTNRDGSQSLHEDNLRHMQTTRPCFYANFMKCHPLNFKGNEGVFVANENGKIDKYISGPPDSIYGNVKSSKPRMLDETIELTNDLMDQKLRTYAERADNKRKTDDTSSGNVNVANAQRDGKETPKGNGCFGCGALGHSKRDCLKLKNKNGGNRNAQGWVNSHGHQQQPFKKQNVAKVYNIGMGEMKPYEGSLPKCTKCQRRHNGPCTQKCHKCNKVGHFARDYRSSSNTNVANAQRDSKETPKGYGCFECEASGHFKRDCLKLKYKNWGKRNAQRWVYAVGNAKKNENAPTNMHSNVVMGTFLLNNRYASILFNIDADRSFISTAFSSLVNIDPTPLVISCSKAQEYMAKECQIFMAQISAKKKEKKSEGKQLKDIPIIWDFPEVFPEDLPGLPPARPVEF
uniref:Reverse transcriptase domain-containing protein n=1 Tax=Tanacetum cinerariifolium TaxID=118510 RepID=A0A6L2MK77_TANCI|nr:reverse transcriptase domain-containing protein [Tanacetum cinerariifolium]